MKTACSQPYRLMIILTIVFGMLSGCASVFHELDDQLDRKRFQTDYAALDMALAVYEEGDFKKARDRFKALSKASASQKLARKARLGEICCRLILADTRAEYRAALGMWHEFTKSAADKDAAWEMALLDPLISHLTPKPAPRVVKTHPPAGQGSVEPTASAGQQDDRQLEAELTTLKKKVGHAEQLQRQMDEVMAENRSLKEKIKALEAIDQKIQEKKTKMSAPSE